MASLELPTVFRQRGDVVTGKNMARFLRVSIGAGAAISGVRDGVQEKRQ